MKYPISTHFIEDYYLTTFNGSKRYSFTVEYDTRNGWIDIHRVLVRTRDIYPILNQRDLEGIAEAIEQRPRFRSDWQLDCWRDDHID